MRSSILSWPSCRAAAAGLGRRLTRKDHQEFAAGFEAKRGSRAELDAQANVALERAARNLAQPRKVIARLNAEVNASEPSTSAISHVAWARSLALSTRLGSAQLRNVSLKTCRPVVVAEAMQDCEEPAGFAADAKRRRSAATERDDTLGGPVMSYDARTIR